MRKNTYMKKCRSAVALAVLAAVAMAWCAARAADYYWSGAEGDDDGTKPGNWIDENGNPMTVAPGVDDALIVTSAVTQIVYPVATTGTMTQFRKIVLAGDVTGVVDFKLGLGGSGVPLGFPPEGFINTTEKGTLRYSVGNLQCIKGTAALRATNIVHVANPGATIECSLHLQGGNEYTDLIKTGYGLYTPWMVNCYATKRRQLVQQGTYKLYSETKNWNTDYIGFRHAPCRQGGCFRLHDATRRGERHDFRPRHDGQQRGGDARLDGEGYERLVLGPHARKALL